MKQTQQKYILWIGIALSIASVILLTAFPHHQIFFSGFVLSILLSSFLRNWKFTAFSFALAVASLFIRYQIIAPSYFIEFWISDLLVILAVLTLTAIAGWWIKEKYAAQDSDRQQITALFEYATEGIILTNEKGEIILINPAALRLFQFSEEEIIGQKIELLIPHRFSRNHNNYRERFNNNPSNRTMGHGRDLFAKKKNGEEFPVEVSLSYYKDNNKIYVIAFIVDITQRKESEQKTVEQKEELERVSNVIRKLNTELESKVEERTMILKEALEELERSQKSLSDALNKEKELNEIKSRFVSMASHEFRTPLSTVLSSASLIARYQKTEEQENRERHIRRIKDSVKHLNDLLEDFLSLGKLEEGKVVTQFAEFDVPDFLQDTIDEMQPILKKNQTIDLTYEGDHFITTDKRLLKNILINLISNAAKFSDESSIIQLIARNLNNELSIQVKDQGIGISQEDLQHMFSSFFRGKNALNIQGTGLGLHIVKRYLDLISGEIHLASELNEGTTISIEVPNQPFKNNE
jgi:PAS domain S-box-containing protein